MKHLRMELPAVAFKSSVAGDVSSYKDCLGADTLLSLLKNYSRNKNLKTAITVGIVGLPNVGKSSLINSLKRTRAVNVGGTPGVTRAAQEVSLDKQVKLLDSPGIVFSGGGGGGSAVTATLRNAVKVEKVADPVAVVVEIVRKCDAVNLQRIYRVQQFDHASTGPSSKTRVALSPQERADRFLHLVAVSAGMLRRGGVPDVVAAARMVLNDWNGGKIPYFTEPPDRTESNAGSDESAIVAGWGAEFNLDEVVKSEKSLVLDALEERKMVAYQRIERGEEMETAIEPPPGRDGDGGDVPELVPLERAAPSGEMDAETAGERRRERKEPPMRARDDPSSLKKRASRAQDLYGSDGQFNPHKARDEKKRKKKMRKQASGVGLPVGGDDEMFDWSVYDDANK